MSSDRPISVKFLKPPFYFILARLKTTTGINNGEKEVFNTALWDTKL